MDRLIPRGQYFKSTTRRLMNRTEKQRVIAAVERACKHLQIKSSSMQIELAQVDNYGDLFCNMRRRMVYLDRWVTLAKGSSQPRHIFRRSRRCSIEQASWKIAKETGAKYLEVREMFFKLMADYVSGDW